MMTLIIGGSGSGKSAYAEKRARNANRSKPLCARPPLYYLATMRIMDEEGKQKVKRHREQRAKKGFLTIEQPAAIGEAKGQIAPDGTVLLECISNLAANEMFSGAHEKDATQVASDVLRGIRRLLEHAGQLFVVTNQVFEDGIPYEAGTKHYMDALGEINRRLAGMADEVIEVVAGIPVVIKKRRKE